MGYHLFLDDSRQPKDVKWLKLPFVNWVVVKTYKEFVNYVMKNGVPTTVTFDHDLANEHYAEYTAAHDERMLSYGRIRYDRFTEKTGYDAAKWLVQYCVDKGTPLPLYYIHTMNPIGRMNIFSVLESARKVMTK